MEQVIHTSKQYANFIVGGVEDSALAVEQGQASVFLTEYGYCL